MTNPIVDVIYGGQFGSEGKRLFNEYYYNMTKPTAIVSNFGPNSGGFVTDGGKWATFVMGAACTHMLSPGSIISTVDFEREKANLPEGAEILIHENASVVSPENLNQEKSLIDIGSTMTGTAASACDKIQRNLLNRDLAKYVYSDYVVSARDWFDLLISQKRIQLCTPQGHSLSLNHGFYPYCTSRNTSPQQGLADAGIPINWVDKIIACMRTFPIRVSNRFDESGKMVGFSGPCYADQNETTWGEVGQKPEMTSVSKKVRRVFSFSLIQYFESCAMNGATDVFLNFANYLPTDDLDMLLKHLNRHIENPPVSWLGFGPKETDIAKLRWVSGDYTTVDDMYDRLPTLVGVNDESISLEV